MKGKGITAELITDTALQLVREHGYGNYTVRDLAARLEVKAASLYKHISSIEEVNREIGRRAAAEMNRSLTEAHTGMEKDAALAAVANAYRCFATKEPELYHAIIGMPALEGNEESLRIGRESFRPIRTVVDTYGVDKATAIHFSRCFRSALHGFVAQLEAGYYTNKDYSADESFAFLIRGFTEWINHLAE